jgi:3-deoxy-7-phosphoheptulonate synthase
MDINIDTIKTLPSPQELILEYSLDQDDILFINNSREIIKNILVNSDSRLLVIIGPCSIHSTEVALEYANHIKSFQLRNPNLFIVMRVYFEKPRSRHGWKGFIYDPDLDETYNINKGIRLARELLVNLTKLRVPIGCEFLDTISPQYLSDTVSWGAIGARTSESQIHRQLASGLSMPIGFKNLTEGDYKKAIDGMISARYPHHFLGIDYNGNACHVTTKGNQYSHLILRGGLEPNYYQKNIEEISKELKKEDIGNTGIVIDCSHGNSQKEYLKQVLVGCSINKLRLLNKYPIRGIMIESNIYEGNQKLLVKDIGNLKYGVSITDGCIDIDSSYNILEILNTDRITKEFTDLNQIRLYLQVYENNIIKLLNEDYPSNTINNKVLTDNVKSPDIIINYDDELFDITKQINNQNSLLLCLLHKRLGISELIASIKYKLSTYSFLLKNNDFYKLVTDRDVEKTILGRINSDLSFEDYSSLSPAYNKNHSSNYEKNTELFIKLMELSKRIQVSYLEEYIPKQKLGYLGTHSTFSYEVINANFNGIHIGSPTLESIYDNLDNYSIDFGLIPTYNSLVGPLYPINKNKYKVIGTIDHKIILSLFSNNSSNDISKVETLYIQEIVLKESVNYINKKFKNINIVTTNTTEEGCLRCIQDKNSITIASTNNKCNFLHMVEDNIISHNVTTFSLIKLF